MYSKAEIERLKTEMIKYEILEQQHRMELDNKRLELERGFLDANKEKQHEMVKINKDTENVIKQTREEKMYWESQKLELTNKIKSL